MTTSMSSVIKVSNAAQRELQAFLHAVSEMFGSDRTQKAGEFWLRALENADGILVDNERFFRKITIQAASQLAKEAL